MACYIVTYPDGTQIKWGENQPRRMVPGEQITGIDWKCNADAQDDLQSLVSSEGLLVGNVIKKVTNALGIKQCLACKGRQRRYNEIGLNVQRKFKELF